MSIIQSNKQMVVHMSSVMLNDSVLYPVKQFCNLETSMMEQGLGDRLKEIGTLFYACFVTPCHYDDLPVLNPMTCP